MSSGRHLHVLSSEAVIGECVNVPKRPVNSSSLRRSDVQICFDVSRVSPSPFDNRHAESPAVRLDFVLARVMAHSHQEVRLDGEKCSSTNGRFGSLWRRFASKASEVEAGLGMEARNGEWLGDRLLTRQGLEKQKSSNSNERY